jgi:hypothetical protein
MGLIEPLDKLAKLRDDGNDLAVWSDFGEFAECLQDELLSNCSGCRNAPLAAFQSAIGHTV